MRRGIGTLVVVAAALLAWPVGTVFAESISQFASFSRVGTFENVFPSQDVDSFGPGNPCGGLRGCIDSTHADLFGDHISSFSAFGTGIMGAKFTGEGGADVSVSAFSQSTFTNSWYCVVCGPHAVGTSVTEFVPIEIALGISGTAANTTVGMSIDLRATLTLSNGTTFQFEYGQDGTDPPTASLDVGQGSIPVTLVQDPVTLNWSFSISKDVSTLVCGPDFPCQPANSPCFATDTCTGVPSFSTSQQISLQYDGNANVGPFFLDASDPFGIQVVSADPNFQFASSDGQGPSAQGTGPITQAPEPESLELVLEGLVGILWLRRRKVAAAS
jgi:hypothetical protein